MNVDVCIKACVARAIYKIQICSETVHQIFLKSFSFCLEFFLKKGLNQRIPVIIGKAVLVFNKSWFSCLLFSKEIEAHSAI